MTKSEVWKDVAEYEGFYQVSNRGNVRSVARRDSIGRKRGGRLLAPSYGGNGYPQVDMYKNGKSKKKYIHRLVAETFLPNTNGFPQVNHRDENKVNNNVKNLEWCTSEYNNSYGTKTERTAQTQSKKVRASNIKTNEVVKFNSTHDAGRKGYDQSSVAKACKGVFKTKAGTLMGGDGRTYKGYKWYYEEEIR